MKRFVMRGPEVGILVLIIAATDGRERERERERGREGGVV